MPVVPAEPESITRATAILRGGGVVAFPTETVYGLGADTFNERALSRVYELKSRPFDNPLIAHVLDIEQAKQVTMRWDARCEALAYRLWPGPLTIVVPKHESVPRRATAGLATIAVRSPSHEAARALLKEFGGPISAPSANRSGRVSPTRAAHVAADFADVDDLLVLDGGPCEVGIESTVLDLSGDEARVLRPGSVSADAIGAVLGSKAAQVDPGAQAASPGTAPLHYAPRTPAESVEPAALAERVSALRERAVVLAIRDITLPPPHELIQMPADPDAYAARLYEALRHADARNVARILIERPEGEGSLWDAIRNRIRRATSR